MSPETPTEYCPNCSSAVHWSLDRCSVCNFALDPPTLRLVATDDELQALDSRYTHAKTKLLSAGRRLALQEFERQVMALSKAIINLPAPLLCQLISNRHNLLSNYHLSVDSEGRLPSTALNDRNRLKVDAAVFGGIGRHIRFASLSMDGRGLRSYGACSLIVRDITCETKATLLEENSYRFFQRHGLGDLRKDFPPGHRSRWCDRHKLATAKLRDKILEIRDKSDIPLILMHDSGNREDDEYIEVHIFGPFGPQSIESVGVPAEGSLSVDEARYIRIIRDSAERQQIKVRELA